MIGEARVREIVRDEMAAERRRAAAVADDITDALIDLYIVIEKDGPADRKAG